MSINELVYHVIDLVVYERRTGTSFVPFGILIVNYRSLKVEFRVLKAQASSRKFSDLERAPY